VRRLFVELSQTVFYVFVHEQNAVAGLTNQALAKIANKVLTGFPSVEGLPKSAQWFGNPVRNTIQADLDQKSEPIGDAHINVLIIGGSQGAHSFNEKLPSVFAQLNNPRLSIWHQSGRDRAQGVVEKYAEQKVEAKVDEFIDDMAAAYESQRVTTKLKMLKSWLMLVRV